MFGLLNNTLQLQGTNVVLPASAVAIGTSTAAASLHIQQASTTTDSGILLQGPDDKKWTLNYSGAGLSFTEDQLSRFQLLNGGNVNIVAALQVGGDLQVDGSLNISGSVSTVNTTATMTHMMKVINNGTGPALTAVQLQDNQPTFEAYHGTVLALQVASNTFVGISLPGAPTQALDVGGNVNASGFSQARNFVTVGSPVASITNIGSTAGGYLAWNRNASGAVMLANAKGTLAGGWEFVSYNADGSFNQIPAIISDAGDLKITGSGSVAGSLSVASKISGTTLNITGAYASVTGNMLVGSSLAAGSLSGTFSTVAGFAYVGSSLTVGSLVTSTALNITGPFASVAGNTAIGSNLTVGSLITATTLYIKGPYASIAGNISVGSNLVAGSVITSTALNVTGPYASITGDTSVGSNLIVGSVVTATALNITGPYASVSGFLSTGSTARLYNSLVGDTGAGSNYAGFQHNTLSTNSTNYAIQQQSDGTSFINAASGKLLHFRNNNNTVANVSASGVRIGDSTAATYALDVLGSSRVADNIFGGVRTPTAQGAWMMWNRTSGRGDTTFMNQIGNGSPGGFQFMNYNVSNVLQNTPLTILGSGLIGVSNTNPAVALDVIGQGNFSSTLTALSLAGTTLTVTGSYMSVTGTLSIGGQINIGSVNPVIVTPGWISTGIGSVSAANSVSIDLPGTGTISFADTLMNYGMLGINCVPSYSVDVSGNLRATGNAVINSANVGTVSGLTGAVFAHNVMMSSTNYALLQSSAGQTMVNAPSGQAILVRNNNVDVANFTPSGLRLGDANAAASTLDVGGNANVQTTLSALNFKGTTLNVTGVFASVTGSLSVGSSLSVGTANPLTVLPGIVYAGTGTIGAPNSSFINLSGVGTISFNDTIVNYGKIGINTTAPAADLDIQGIANVSSTLTALNIAGTTLLVTGTFASILGNLAVGSTASISGNAAIGTSLTVGSVITATALNINGPYASISGNVNVGTFLNVQGSGTFGGNVVVTGFVQASNFAAAGSSTTLAGNVTIGTNLTVGGTITGTALIITGSYASVAGNLQLGSLLTVGSLITSTALNITGPYASVSGNASIGSVLIVGSAASFLNNISVTGTISASNFLTSGATFLSNVLVSSNLTALGSISGTTLNISGPFASISGNASIGSSLVVSSQLSATSLNITGPFASISGSVNIGSNVVIAGSLMATVLNIGGSYSSLAGGISVGGLVTNNVYGNLHLKVYDESGVYNNVGAGSVGGALPAMFTSKPTLTLHANSINLTNQTFGTLSGKYSVRYTGYVQPPSTGTYTFRLTYQDGATLWIGVEKLVNSWKYQSGTASSVATLTMYANIWSPFSLEHTCATSAEKLLVEWNVNGGAYTPLQHAVSNFQFGYEIGDLPHTQLSTTYVSGQLFAGDSIVAPGLILPNSPVFTGATSQLYNDAGFITYLGSTITASAASVSGTVSTGALVTTGPTSFTGSNTYVVMQAAGSLSAYASNALGVGGSLSTQAALNLNTAGTGTPYVGFDAFGVSGASIGLDPNDAGKLKFISGSGAGQFSTASTRMTITPAGLIGIRNTAPAYGLDVGTTTRIVTPGAMPLLVQTGSSTSNGLLLQLSGTSGAQDVGIGFIQPGITAYGIVQRAGSNGRLSFVNNLYPGSAGAEQVSFLSTNGNVGIGNTAPALKLDVSGVIGRSAAGGDTVYSCPGAQSHVWQINQSSSNALLFNQANGFYPAADNMFPLGSSAGRWSTIYGVAATISGVLTASTVSSTSLTAQVGSISTLAVGSLATVFLQASTLTVGSFSSTYSNILQSYAATLTVGTGGGSFAGTVSAASFTNIAAPQYTLDVTGTARVTGFITQSFTRVFDTVTNGIGSIASYTGNTGSYNFDVDVIISGGSQTFLAQYRIAAGYNVAGNTWKRCMPLGAANSTPDEYELQISNTGNLAAATFRLVHVNANVASSVTVNIMCKYNQNDPPTIANLTGTAQTTDPNLSTYGYLSTTMITQRGGNVGIGLNLPAYTLDVNGSARVTGSLLTQQLLGQTSTQGANDTIFIGPGGGNVFLDRSGGINGSFIFNYNTPVASGNSTTFQVYNGATNRQVLLGVNAAGSISGSNFTYINSGLSVGQNSAPAYTLDVNGTARVSGQSVLGIFFPDSSIGASSGLVARVYNVSFAMGPQQTSVPTGAGNTVAYVNTDYNIQNQTGSFPGGRLQVADDNYSADFRWQTKAPGGVNNSLVERLSIIGNSGNVGVNNTSPQYTLDVSGSCRVTGAVSGGSYAPNVSTYTTNTSTISFATPYAMTVCYGRAYLYGNGGQGAPSAFNLRLGCSNNGGSSFDTGNYTVTITQSNAGALSAISQSGYPTIATGVAGYLNNCAFQIQPVPLLKAFCF